MVADLPAIEVTHVGGPTTRIEVGGVTFVVDPTFDSAGAEYVSGPVTLKKTKGPALAAEELGSIEVVLLTHDQHPDNLDQKGRELLKGVPLILTTVSGARRLGNEVIGLEPWQTRIIESQEGYDLQITATPARHGPPGVRSLTGDVIGFVISVADSGVDLVYATGDTVWYEETLEVARRFEPCVVLLHVGAAKTARGPFELTMDANGALEAAAAFRSSMLVPVHADGWTHLTQSLTDLEQAFGALGQSHRLQPLVAGVPTSVCKGSRSDANK